MIGRLNHFASVVPDLAEAIRIYAVTLGAEVSEPADMPEHGVTTVFVELPNTKVELLHPLGDASPIAAYLERNPAGTIQALEDKLNEAFGLDENDPFSIDLSLETEDRVEALAAFAEKRKPLFQGK